MGALNRFCRRIALGGGLLLALMAQAFAQDQFIEDIRVTADRDTAIILIEFACQMRFVADSATAGGALLEVRVAPFDTCRQQGIGSGLERQTYRPIGAEAAHLVEVEFDSLGLGDSLVQLTFDRPVRYTVTQRPTLRAVEIAVDLAESLGSDAPTVGRAPLSVRVIEPRVTQDYMINLQSTREPVDPNVIDSVALAAGNQLYVSQIRVDGQVWNRLRVGFFPTEADARSALEGLLATFPRAWIGRAESKEITLAAESSLAGDRPRVVTLTTEQLESDPSPLASLGAVDPEQIAPLMIEARNALINGDTAAAVQSYGRLSQTPGEHRAEALEFLGLAYERSGDPARARSEYERALREFPQDPNRPRVQQRLNSLIAMQDTTRTTLRDAQDSSGGEWEWSMGLSQYYRRNDNQFDEDLPSETTQSALLTDADFSLGRSGQRVDLLARVSLNNYRDLLDPAEGGRGDQNRFSYAYVDVAQSEQQWDLRLGRQSLHTWGVLGRFDGAHFSYGLGTDKRLHFTTGYPVESTRDSVETDRQFTGLAIEFTDLVGDWDMAAFLNSQTIEGVAARMAVGTEARYFDERRSLTAMLDYDVDFAELNMVLVLGTWRLANRMTLSALVDQRKSPILSTRNALIGQPVETIQEMLLVWTEEEVRNLALDRTSDSKTVTLGVATPLGERLQLNFDVTTSEISGSVTSGGVLAIPGSGLQTFYSTSLVATGLFATSDVNIWNLRIGQADTYQTKLLTWDARFPIGRHLRINPRVRFVVWEGLVDVRERRSVSPSLRLLLNARNRYRLEFEIGTDQMTRMDATSERDSSGSYVSFGYRANF